MQEQPTPSNSQHSAQLIKGSSVKKSSQQKRSNEVVRSYDEGQLQDDGDELGQVQLKTTPSVEVRRSVEVSTQLPDINIRANKSVYVRGENGERDSQKVKIRKPYSEPRNDDDEDEDHFSDRSLSQTQSEVRKRNLYISLGFGALAALGGYYASKEDKRICGIAGIVGFFGSYFFLSRD